MFSKSFSVAVTVSDAKKAAKWYKQTLGFEVSTEDEHWVTAGVKGAPWKLHLCETELEPGNTGICFYSENVKKTVDGLKKKGVKFSREYKKSEGGETALIEDPDGNIFWISSGTA
jgi:predicted enzyme related to lactoylglutathione lyase